MTEQLDITVLRAWIGREEILEDYVAPSLVDRFRATLDLPGPAAAVGNIAPRLIHFCLCQSPCPTETLGTDGHPARGQFLPPVPLPRRMWASSTIDFMGDLRIGDTVRRRSHITNVEIKTGRTGPLCFVTIRHDLDANGIARVSEQQTLVYRGPDFGPAPTALSPASGTSGVRAKSVKPTHALLFRYSALTFNSHRIHYDLAYATREEGYPGLVVQGPLQATLLMNLATETRGGSAPDRFGFRCMAPAFVEETLLMQAGEVIDDHCNLSSAGPGGRITMQATAAWSR